MQPSPDSDLRVHVLIADDHPMMRLGIKGLLSTQKHIKVVGEAATGDETLDLARRLSPDIILMDISMPGLSGLEVTKLLHHEMPEVKVIILTMHDEREYVLQFIKSGASGYVLKNNPPSELLQAIESTRNGGAYFSPSISQIILEQQRQGVLETAAGELTSRERQVLSFLAQGRSSKQIADELCLSIRTVTKYRESIMQKLNLHTVAELTQYAISKKLIEIESP